MGPGLSGTSWKTSLCSCQVPFSSSLGAEGGCVYYHIERMRRQVKKWQCHSITHFVLIFENHRLRVVLVGTKQLRDITIDIVCHLELATRI